MSTAAEASQTLRRSARAATKRVTDAISAPAAKKKRTTTTTPSEKKPSAPKKPAAKSKPNGTSTAGKDENPAAAAEPAINAGDSLPADLPAVQTHSGETITLQQLLEKTEKGIVIFAYPRASTPGCTTQACSFRDNIAPFKAGGYAVYGISGDTPSANAKFKEKQKLEDITMLCDGDYSLHRKLGIAKGAKGTVRSVLVVAKDGKVLGKGPASPANSVPLAKGWAGIDEKKE